MGTWRQCRGVPEGGRHCSLAALGARPVSHGQHCHHCGTSGAVIRGTLVGHGAIHGKTPCRTLAILPSRLRPVSRDGQAA